MRTHRLPLVLTVGAALLAACPATPANKPEPTARPVVTTPTSLAPSQAFVRPPSPEGPLGPQPVGGIGTGSLGGGEGVVVDGSVASPAPSPLQQEDQKTGRQARDQADVGSGPFLKAIVLLPADGADRALDLDPRLARSLKAIDLWFTQEAQVKLRWDLASNSPDVGFVRSRYRAQELRSANGRVDRAKVLASLAEAGFEAQAKAYAVWYDGAPNSGAESCTENSTGTDTTAGLALFDVQACAGEDFGATDLSFQRGEAVLAHEILHALGAVQACAPGHALGHVRAGGDDLMQGVLPQGLPKLDPGRDDYFGHGREDCLDLARSPFLLPSSSTVQGPYGFARVESLPTTAQAVGLNLASESNGVKVLGALVAEGPQGSVDLAFRITASRAGEPARVRLKVDGRWSAMSVGAPLGREAQVLASINSRPDRASLVELYVQRGQAFLPTPNNPGARLLSVNVEPRRGLESALTRGS